MDEHSDILTNIRVKKKIADEPFFMTCRTIVEIMKPIKYLINLLEAQTATLCDCFVGLIRLAAVIYHLPSTNDFKPLALKIFNDRFTEFNHEAYILSYFLHPQYRGKI